MKCALSIVHGASRLLYPKGYQKDWLAKLRDALIISGIELVEPYYWSGNILMAFAKNEARSYAKHLQQIQKKCQKQNIQHINIIAKSLGSILVRNGINLLNSKDKKIKINNFIRIATPDNNWCADKTIAKSIININSSSDKLYKVSRFFLPSIVKVLYPNDKKEVQEVLQIELNELQHSDFNKNIYVNDKKVFEGYLFELYYLLASDDYFLSNNKLK